MSDDEGIYARCKAQVRAIGDAYDALVAAVEDYKTLLTALAEARSSEDARDKHLLVVINLQRNTATGLLNTLDTDIHDDLVRLSDRVIRFKHWEEGIFV